MPIECNPSRFDFARVQGRAVVAGLGGGRITPDAGALLRRRCSTNRGGCLPQK